MEIYTITKDEKMQIEKELKIFRSTIKEAEAEILRLREGLRRCKDFICVNSLDRHIDKLLKIEETTEF